MADSVLTVEVKDVLSRATTNGNVLVLPPGQLERGLYEKVHKALQNAGGKWKRGVGHVFTSDAGPKLAAMLEAGVSIDEKKHDQAFFTPSDLAESVAALADVRGHDVLEPSAGTGALADACMRAGARSVHCVEINAASVAVLRGKGYQVTYDDFLRVEPDRLSLTEPVEPIEPGIERWLPVVGYEEFYEVSTHGNVPNTKLTPLAVESIKQRLRDGEARDLIASDYDITTATVWAIDNGRTWLSRLPLFSRIILNPPFTKNQDITHVRHALKWLAPGGILVAIMLNNQTRKAFHDLKVEYGPEIEEVERGAFRESGTDVPTIIVKIQTGEINHDKRSTVGD